MKAFLNRLMSALGYLPRRAVDELKAQVERFGTSIEASKASLQKLSAATQAFERAMAPLNAAPAAAQLSTLDAFAELAPTVTAAAEKRFATDPFASTFELDPGEDAVTITLYPRSGSVQYLINVTGPRSTAIKFEGALPKLVHVSRVLESQL